MAGPELTADTTGNPFVEVYFDPSDLTVDTARIRITRFSDNRQWLVRGGVDIAPGVAAADFEAPFGVTSQYRAEQFDAAGASLGLTDVASITLNVADVWVHNPLYPGEGVRLGAHTLLRGTASRNSRPLIGSAINTQSGGVPTWIGARRSGISRMPLGFAVESVEAMDALQRMLGDYENPRLGVLCVRTPPPIRIPRTFFTSAEDPDEQFGNTQWGGTRSNFWLTGDEVRPPFPGIADPLLSYEDMEAAYSTYELAQAEYGTYEEAQRDYSLAGLGG